MYKLRRFLGISITLIYFTFIYSHQDNLVRRQVLASGAQEASTKQKQPTTSNSGDMALEDDGLTDWDKRALTERSQDALKQLFRLKTRPDKSITTTNTKFYVPRAMLEEYMASRDLVRDFIPDDRDFLGKLDIHGSEDSMEKIWSHVYDTRGRYELEVDMEESNKEPEESMRSKHKGEVEHLVHITLDGDPIEVPANIEPQLPPHVTSVQHQKQYISVHLKFKLSQEVYTKLAIEEVLVHAELHLFRDKISGCLFEKCDRKPITLFNKKPSVAQNQFTRGNQTRPRENFNERIAARPKIEPAYQRVFVLLITGYDDLNEPMTAVIANTRISTKDNQPLTIDLGLAVKKWVKNPSTNHGIIVRVRNDDEIYEQQMQLLRQLAGERAKTGDKRRDPRSTNASDTESEAVIPEIAFLEQVRLKRGFEQSSDDDDTWRIKQPYIVAYSQPADRHKKRHIELEEDDTEGMQADDPGVTTGQYQQTSTSTSIPSSSTQSSRDAEAQTDKSHSANTQTSTHESVTKRDHIPTPANSGRRGQQSNRPPNNGRASSLQQGGGSSQRPKGKGKPPVRQPDKCSKKPLKINFDEVGWSSWIIAPHSYYANYCSGECTWPLADAQNSTNHAIIQAIYHSVGRVVPKSCCAPVKLARMAILYQLDGIVQMRQYDDMIIEACGCL